MGLTNVTRLLASTAPPPARPAHRPTVPPPSDVVVLKHCRCMDCRNFSKVASNYYCSKHIGGTAVVWGTGKRFCDPLPDAWHYCAGYHGPQVSKDVWVWPKATPRAAQGGAGSNISVQAEVGPTNTPEPSPANVGRLGANRRNGLQRHGSS